MDKQRPDTNIKEFREVLKTIRNKTCSIADAEQYVDFMFSEIINVPIPTEQKNLEGLEEYYGAWKDLLVEIKQRYKDFKHGH